VRAPAAALILASLCCAQPALSPGRKYTTVERLAPERLAAVQAARQQLAAQRKALPPHGVYEDFRTLFHIHAEDSAHTLGKRAEVLAAAKATGVRAIFWGDHGGPKPDSWSGLRDGVLFVRGAENGSKHELLIAEPAPDLRLHSHVEGQLDAPFDGWDGMEIYNRHTDAEDDTDLLAWLKAVAGDPARQQQLAALFERFPDEIFGAGCDYWPAIFQRWDRALERGAFPGIAANDAHQNTLVGKLQLDPYPVAFRNVSTHLLARELTADSLREALRAGRGYVAHDWLADPTGFTLVAVNTLGVYHMGDAVPMLPGTRVEARTPVPAVLKLIHKGQVVATQTGDTLTFKATSPGTYRMEAWLEMDGEQRPWIYSNALVLKAPDLSTMALPPATVPAGVLAVKDLPYVDNGDPAKQRLDIYRPDDGKTHAVVVFVHGGAWVRGDRSQYPAIGGRLAAAGLVVVVPSYRLAPKHPHPAQIEDAAAAVAWTVKNIARHGGDPKRIFLAGHSAGGHLVSLLATNPQWLAKHELKPADFRGVLALSGVYDVALVANLFGPSPESIQAASPLRHTSGALPPFLVTYCEFDYAFLPQQARLFDAALRRSGQRSRLVFVPGENHISEIISVLKDTDATWRAATEFLRDLGGF
jgi:acetyl esterase/lipase